MTASSERGALVLGAAAVDAGKAPARKGVSVSSGAGGVGSASAGRASKARPTGARSARNGDQRVKEAATLVSARSVWSRLVTSESAPAPQVQYRSPRYSLSLDPSSYLLLATPGRGSVLVDSRGKLPPAIETLLREKYPNLVVISEPASNRKRFFSSLLRAGRFYSTEEDFSVSFGDDPRVTVEADFKVEKGPESVLAQDVVLLNVSQDRVGFPSGLTRLLADNGFQLIEGASPEAKKIRNRHLLQVVATENPKKILDCLLDVLSVRYVRKHVTLLVREESGLRLELLVDRFFRYRGEDYVALLADDEQSGANLIPLLEGHGIGVVALEQGDNLASVTSKLATALELKLELKEHELWPRRQKGYGVSLSGIMIRNRKNGAKTFLTDRPLSPAVREMVQLNGYRIVTGR